MQLFNSAAEVMRLAYASLSLYFSLSLPLSLPLSLISSLLPSLSLFLSYCLPPSLRLCSPHLSSSRCLSVSLSLTLFLVVCACVWGGAVYSGHHEPSFLLWQHHGFNSPNAHVCVFRKHEPSVLCNWRHLGLCCPNVYEYVFRKRRTQRSS